MEKQYRIGLSYENTRRLMERKGEIDRTFDDIISQGMRQSRKQANSEINKKLYEFAERQGVSLWDICFNYIPRVHPSEPKIENFSNVQNFNIEYDITIEPLYLEFEQGPGYWKGKYCDLKRKLQELIDARNEM